jgi:hypothetical protein
MHLKFTRELAQERRSLSLSSSEYLQGKESCTLGHVRPINTKKLMFTAWLGDKFTRGIPRMQCAIPKMFVLRELRTDMYCNAVYTTACTGTLSDKKTACLVNHCYWEMPLRTRINSDLYFSMRLFPKEILSLYSGLCSTLNACHYTKLANPGIYTFMRTLNTHFTLKILSKFRAGLYQRTTIKRHEI